ncbi:MAG: DUF502 domain-containing protein [Gemmatimonadetes bacterium]|nr:DUF502 domain-containing protein [Gemmatimonadota bacterium]
MSGPHPVQWRRKLRRYFFTGLVVLAPVGATIAILVWLFQKLDAILGDPLRGLLGVRVPGLGLVLLAVAIVLLGWVAHYTIGRQLITWWNAFLARFPLTARLYNATSQIVQTFMGDQRRIFLRTVLIEFPTPGSFALAWVTSEDNPFAEAVLGEPCVNVFVATTPNPTSGYFLIVPKRKTTPVDLSIEEGMKLVISAGAVLPQTTGSPPPKGLDLATLLRKSAL